MKDAVAFLFENTFPAIKGHVVRTSFADIEFEIRDRTIGGALLFQGQFGASDLPYALELSAGARKSTQRIYVEVGANIGTTLLQAMATPHFDRGIAFEPMPENVTVLRCNISRNGLAEKVAVVNAALSNIAGHGDLWVSDRNSGKHRLKSPNALSETTAQEGSWHQRAIKIQLTTLDETLDRLGIDPSEIGLVWMDAEFHEGEVLEGGAKTFAITPAVVAEFYPFFLFKQSKMLFPQLARANFSHFIFVNGPFAGAKHRIDELTDLFERNKTNIDFAADILLLKSLS